MFENGSTDIKTYEKYVDRGIPAPGAITQFLFEWSSFQIYQQSKQGKGNVGLGLTLCFDPR